MSTEPSVVVVGGGYGGVNTAKALDPDASVVLVEAKDTFVHNVGSLRALVDPVFAPRIFLPYTRLLASGRVVHGRAVKVGAHRVVVASSEEIAADYIVLATGSRYPFPAKSDLDDAHAAVAKYQLAHDRLEQASRVLLVGAGPVGIELAGEIKAVWPRTDVLLLDVADDLLGPAFRADLKAELRTQLAEIGVELSLGDGLRALPSIPPAELGAFTVTTDSGREITADMWFRCFGVHPESDFLDGDLARARTPHGFVRTRPTLQVEGFDNVFAIGDVADIDAKMAGRAGRQAQLAAENIRLLIDGRADALASYVPSPPAIIVPIGPHLGSGQLPNQEELASREMVAAAKGNDLMVDRYADILGSANV